MIREENEGKMG